MDNNICFVQFLHPGKEHRPERRSFEKKWNRGKHKRKFLKLAGSYDADGKLKNGEIVFWGEWEPESRVVRAVSNPIAGQPSFVYEPYYVIPRSYAGLQSTDPFVFGERFIYGNCLQGSFARLRRLSRGSVILFGSCSHGVFILDTVFVVDHSKGYAIGKHEMLAEAVSEGYREVTMCPLAVWSAACKTTSCAPKTKGCTATDAEETLCLYFGATYQQRVNGMYSFFPCLPYEEMTRGFARPRIRLPEINNRQSRGINPHVGTLDEMKILWGKVTNQVRRQQLCLGVHATMPEPE